MQPEEARILDALDMAMREMGRMYESNRFHGTGLDADVREALRSLDRSRALFRDVVAKSVVKRASSQSMARASKQAGENIHGLTEQIIEQFLNGGPAIKVQVQPYQKNKLRLDLFGVDMARGKDKTIIIQDIESEETEDDSEEVDPDDWVEGNSHPAEGCEAKEAYNPDGNDDSWSCSKCQMSWSLGELAPRHCAKR